MHSEPEPPATISPLQAGGVGLYDHTARDPFPRSAGPIAGALAVGLTIVLASLFWSLNPAFHTGSAGGTANMLGAAPR
jgi:hypothetical protein